MGYRAEEEEVRGGGGKRGGGGERQGGEQRQEGRERGIGEEEMGEGRVSGGVGMCKQHLHQVKTESGIQIASTAADKQTS